MTTLRQEAGLTKFTYHDFRRSCITNWAKALQAHVVHKLAGHSSIKTTQQYYLSVQEDDGLVIGAENGPTSVTL